MTMNCARQQRTRTRFLLRAAAASAGLTTAYCCTGNHRAEGASAGHGRLAPGGRHACATSGFLPARTASTMTVLVAPGRERVRARCAQGTIVARMAHAGDRFAMLD